MNKYIVNIQEVHYVPVEVEANNEQEARKKVEKLNRSGELDYNNSEYSHDLPVSDWLVFKID